jgi:hypothetical protein
MTMVTPYTTIEAAEARIALMKDRADLGFESPEDILESEGVEPKQCWIEELTGEESYF